MLKHKILGGYGSIIRWVFKPAFAPLFRDIYDQQRRVVSVMMDNNHYYVDDLGYVKEKALLDADGKPLKK